MYNSSIRWTATGMVLSLTGVEAWDMALRQEFGISQWGGRTPYGSSRGFSTGLTAMTQSTILASDGTEGEPWPYQELIWGIPAIHRKLVVLLTR